MNAPPAPDQTRGLFETLLLLGGEPVELDAHLERLAAGLADVYGATPPADLATEIEDRAGGIELGRMRVDVRPADGETTAALRTEAVDPGDFFPGPERAVSLRGVRCDGGLGPYKWADRDWLDRAGAGSVPLLLDRGEEVLEAGRANVFAAIDGVLTTPRADGRILPGTARAGTIAAARENDIELIEAPLTRRQLLEADEVFLTGSVRGVEPAGDLDGVQLPPPGPISRRVGDDLRRRWLDGSLAAIAGPVPAAGRPPGPHAR